MLAIVVRFTTKKEGFKFFTTEHICFTWFWWNLFDIDYQHTERRFCWSVDLRVDVRPPLRSGYHVKGCCKEHVGLSVNLAPPAMETFALSVY